MARKVDRSMNSGLSERLIAARESVGLDRSQAAERLGVTYAALHSLESGRKTPSLDRLYEIATAWNIDPAILDQRLASTGSVSQQPAVPPHKSSGDDASVAQARTMLTVFKNIEAAIKTGIEATEKLIAKLEKDN